MKNLFPRLNSCIIAIILLFLAGVCNAQGSAWVKALYSGCYLQTDPNSRFTWSGGCSSGYCDGYGTIQWYDDYGNKSSTYVGYLKYGKADGFSTQYYPNGNIYYQGYWQNDMKNGFGTYYYSDGSIKYQGNFVDDKLENISYMEAAGWVLGALIMNKAFGGGTDLEASVIKAVNTQNKKEWRIRISFADETYSNVNYKFTLVLSNEAPLVDFVDMNLAAKVKLTFEVADLISDYLKEHDNN